MKTKAELPLITLVKRKEETSEPEKGEKSGRNSLLLWRLILS